VKYKALLLCFISLIFANNNLGISLKEVAKDFDRPILVTFQPDNNSMYVVEQKGKIKIVKSNSIETFLDISDKVKSGPVPDERGLLGMAFDKEFSSNGIFYISYIDLDNFSVVSRFIYDHKKKLVQLSSEERIIYFKQPYNNHNGGHLGFSPVDNYLYVAFGDGGSAGDPQNNAQNLSNFMGKILRLDVSKSKGYTIPFDNPFYNSNDAKKEIWAYGLRNPWRFSFDRENGDLFVGDVGQYLWEEINKISFNQSGVNFGWKIMEGNHCYDSEECDKKGLTNPIFNYPSDASYAFSLMGIKQKDVYGCSVTGGYLYRGDKINRLKNLYLFSDFCSGKVWALNQDNLNVLDVTEELFFDTKNMISSFGQDINGELYIVEFSGTIYKIIASNE